MRTFVIALVLLSLIVAAAPSLAAVTQVNVASFSFSPRSVTVSVGDTVKWVWQNGTHTATSGDTTACTPDGVFNGPLDLTHPTFLFRFTSAGDFPYYCFFHCSLMHMRGVVHVQTQSGVPDNPGIYEGRLLRVAPNPFQPRTALSFRVEQAGPVRLEVFDAAGRLVATLADRDFEAGQYSVHWDGRTLSGEEAPSGVYFARWTACGSTTSAVLMRTR